MTFYRLVAPTYFIEPKKKGAKFKTTAYIKHM